jgi:hypothetical protein
MRLGDSCVFVGAGAVFGTGLGGTGVLLVVASMLGVVTVLFTPLFGVGKAFVVLAGDRDGLLTGIAGFIDGVLTALVGAVGIAISFGGAFGVGFVVTRTAGLGGCVGGAWLNVGELNSFSGCTGVGTGVGFVDASSAKTVTVNRVKKINITVLVNFCDFI